MTGEETQEVAPRTEEINTQALERVVMKEGNIADIDRQVLVPTGNMRTKGGTEIAAQLAMKRI